MGLLESLRAKLEYGRLEKRYTQRRQKRTAFEATAQYVDGEYIYDSLPPSAFSSPSPSRTTTTSSLSGPAMISRVTVGEAILATAATPRAVMIPPSSPGRNRASNPFRVSREDSGAGEEDEEVDAPLSSFFPADTAASAAAAAGPSPPPSPTPQTRNKMNRNSVYVFSSTPSTPRSRTMAAAATPPRPAVPPPDTLPQGFAAHWQDAKARLPHIKLTEVFGGGPDGKVHKIRRLSVS